MASLDGADFDHQVASLSKMLLSEETLNSALQRTADLAVAAIGPCTTCSVTLASQGQLGTPVAYDALAEQLDQRQYEANQGPCLDAVKEGRTHLVPSMADEARWPQFTDAARQAGVVSSLSIPLTVGGERVGALNMYSTVASFTENDEASGSLFGAQASVTLANARTYEQARQLVDNLRTAVDSRDVIGQAKGIIMERERCTSEAAFALLVAISQRRNMKVREVAREVVETGAWERP